jgi:hypothetical protein
MSAAHIGWPIGNEAAAMKRRQSQRRQSKAIEASAQNAHSRAAVAMRERVDKRIDKTHRQAKNISPKRAMKAARKRHASRSV